MTIKELFDQAIKNDFTDLQALIMFLVFEKQVVNMQDDTKELDLYFLDKHNTRMNKELHEYKQKMKIRYKKTAYEATNGKETIYVLADSLDHAKLVASRYIDNVTSVKPINKHTQMIYKDRHMTLIDVIKTKKTEFLGGFKVENIYQRKENQKF